jgi:hypothetical protein
MTIRTFRYAAGGFAGALAMLAGGFACAATLNQNLRTGAERPQFLVSPADRISAPATRSRAVLIAEGKKPLPGIKQPEPPATAAEIVGRLLAPGASNPDVPLPHPDLSEEFSTRPESGRPLRGPTPYGRTETGGGILGFRMPIPVERSGTAATTTSSPGAPEATAPIEGPSRPR